MELDEKLDGAWKKTCKILFGKEIGDLKEYEKWMALSLPERALRKSCVSGKDVLIAMDAYGKDAAFVRADESQGNKDYGLGINQLKDIDSIINAIREKCEYTGNRYLGNSTFVEQSDIVMDSHYVRNSTNIE